MEETRGFTLIELMITVAIIGLLASLAIPQYQAFLLRSKRAELPMNTDAIRTVEQAYRAEWSFFTACALAPTTVGRQRRPFPYRIGGVGDWNMLGWVPDGPGFGQYEVSATFGQGDDAHFTANGYGDIDGDANLSHYQGTEVIKPIMMTGNTVY